MNESGGSGGAATGPTGRAAPLIALIRRWRVLISAAFPHVDPVRSRSIPLEMGQLETTWSPQFRFHPFVYLAICARLFPITPPFFSISNCFGIFRDFYGFIEDLTRSSADSFLFSRANLPRLSSTTLHHPPHPPAHPTHPPLFAFKCRIFRWFFPRILFKQHSCFRWFELVMNLNHYLELKSTSEDGVPGKEMATLLWWVETRFRKETQLRVALLTTGH